MQEPDRLRATRVPVANSVEQAIVRVRTVPPDGVLPQGQRFARFVPRVSMFPQQEQPLVPHAQREDIAETVTAPVCSVPTGNTPLQMPVVVQTALRARCHLLRAVRLGASPVLPVHMLEQLLALARTVPPVSTLMPVLAAARTVPRVNTPQSGLVRAPRVLLASGPA
jgi:hypothetical protein